MKRLGLIVNPVAGLGGRVGLKGSDGAQTQTRALMLGAVPRAGARAAAALQALHDVTGDFELVTCPGPMGADVARICELDPVVVDSNLRPDRSTHDSRENKGSEKTPQTDSADFSNLGRTTAADTRRAAQAMRDLGVALLLFAGGDGTARDIAAAIGTDLPALGIPAGVKMHSAVFTHHPHDAGALAARALSHDALALRDAEVLDLDEEAYRNGDVAPRLYGYLRVPVGPRHMQNRKAPSPAAETAQLDAIAADVIEQMRPGWLYVLGPGTTTRAIATRLGVEKTLVGVDVVQDGALIARDISESQLAHLIAGHDVQIVVTPIGGQGFLFGRGNQQLSPAVIQAVGPENIVVVATSEKLSGLGGRPLQVDSGDAEIDALLAGHIRIITGYHERAMYRMD